MKPNRVGYGDTAFSKRALAHRAQTSAGGFSSSGMTPEQIADSAIEAFAIASIRATRAS